MTSASVPGAPGAPGAPGVGRPAPARLGPLSALQRNLWEERRRSATAGGQVRAVRLTGQLDERRLVAAVTEVVEAVEVLRVGVASIDGVPAMIPGDRCPAVSRTRVDAPASERDRRCVAILSQDRDRPTDPRSDPLVRFHLVRCAPDELVLGLVADPLVLDLRSIYLVLGAVQRAYFGRFRPAEYPTFAGVAGLDPVGGAARQGRRDRWSRRLRDRDRTTPRPVTPGSTRTRELVLDADRWAGLTRVADHAGNTGSLAVIALLTWWFQVRSHRTRPAVFASGLDLRDYLGLGPVIGPLTDRMVVEVDLAGFADLTFGDLVRRVHAGVLDAAVHYLPYGEIVSLGDRPGYARPRWDVAVHYCRRPPASSHTRGEQTLARRGMSIELFGESELVRTDPAAGAVMDVHLAESGAGMALVLSVDTARLPDGDVTALLDDVAEVIGAVVTDPTIPLSQLTHR